MHSFHNIWRNEANFLVPLKNVVCTLILKVLYTFTSLTQQINNLTIQKRCYWFIYNEKIGRQHIKHVKIVQINLITLFFLSGLIRGWKVWNNESDCSFGNLVTLGNYVNIKESGMYLIYSQVISMKSCWKVSSHD